MSSLIAAPEMITAAATDLRNIGSTLGAAHAAAAPTTALIPAAADEVSAGIAQLFSGHAMGYQAQAAQAAAFHAQFVHNLTASAEKYAGAEAANAAALQPLHAIAGPIAGAANPAANQLTIFLANAIVNAILLLPPQVQYAIIQALVAVFGPFIAAVVGGILVSLITFFFG
jgi:PE family